MTLASRVSGFVRDVLTATLFGAGLGMDAFLVAFMIPNFMRRMFSEGAFLQSFVPVFAEAKTTQTIAGQRQLLSVVSGTLGGVLLLITVLGVAGAPLLMSLFAPGFSEVPGKSELGAGLLRIMFPYLMLISLTAMVAGVLNSHGRFAVPALTPVLLNVCMVGAALLYSDSIYALAWAVLLAGFVQFGFQLPTLARLGLMARPRWGWQDPQVRRIVQLMLPILFGSSIAQLSLLLNTLLASLIPGNGSVSWLYYADRVMEFPLGIFSIAIATVILPSLSAQHAQKSPEHFSATLDWGLRMLLLIGLPAMLGLLLLAGPLVTTLFQYSRFTANDVEMTMAALMAYAFGFMGFSLVKVLVPGFYARQETRIPVRYGVIALTAGMVVSASLTWLLVRQGFFAPHIALAISTSFTAWINAGLLFWRLNRDGTYRPQPGWIVFALRLFAANLAMALLLVWLAGDLAGWLSGGAGDRALRMLEVISACAALYFAVLWVGGLRPRHLRHSI
ncbi:MAG: murein biosynthesis integral membrane protein MurJ [Pseudomonadota bacterium]